MGLRIGSVLTAILMMFIVILHDHGVHFFALYFPFIVLYTYFYKVNLYMCSLNNPFLLDVMM